MFRRRSPGAGRRRSSTPTTERRHEPRNSREAVALAEATDHLNDQGEALCDLAEVLSAAGRTGEAVAAFEQALDRYERKKNLAMVAQVRARLETLRAGSRA